MANKRRTSLVKFMEEVADCCSIDSSVYDDADMTEGGNHKIHIQKNSSMRSDFYNAKTSPQSSLQKHSSKTFVTLTNRPLREKKSESIQSRNLRKSSCQQSRKNEGGRSRTRSDQSSPPSRSRLLPRRESDSDTSNNYILRQRSSITTSFYDDSEQLQHKKDKKRSSIKSFLNSCTTESRTIDEQVLQQKESRGILCLRLLTISTLVTAATIVASLTYAFIHKSEMSEFRTEYESAVAKVEEAIGSSIKNKLAIAQTFAAMYTSRYGPENKWPNATMPDFQHISEGQLDIASAIALSYNPIINGTDQQRVFEAYATEVAYSLGAKQLVERSCDTCRVVADGIFRKVDGVTVDDSGISPESRYPEIMVPVWQIFPTKVNWRAVMFNLHSETNRQHALDDMLEYQVPTVTALLHLVQHDEMNPSSILFYPVFDRFEKEVESDEEEEILTSEPFPSPIDHQRRIMGSISIVFTWEDILRRVLPSYIEGMTVVLEASVSSELPRQLWTYEVNGKDVILLGEGDLHDEQYYEYEHVVNANVAYDAEELGIVDHLITYELRMYPSERFETRHTSQRPGILTCVVVCIFALTSFIFLLYDWLVKNRQNAVMEFASRSGTIVNNLFPENVRDRLMDNAHHFSTGSGGRDIESQETRRRKSSTPRRRAALDSCTTTSSIGSVLKDSISKKHKFVQENVKTILRKGRSFSNGEHTGHTSKNVMVRRSSSTFNLATGDGLVNLSTPPIADLFPETSIMFADIVGFTEWSSNHSPDDVFRLLETLFFEFDRLATMMNVFKLGTIGDCYIAVTGIPDARPDHAEVLCEFAEGCRIRMNRVVSDLHDSLGDVNMLSMRFGIHSGPVTAGVLRGQKSRFELFGDTINTASRMESNGLPNKIQISQETADLLVTAGFEHCIKPRTMLVQAKGKGMLQTYWFDTSGENPEDEENKPSNNHPFNHTHEDMELTLGRSPSNEEDL